MTSAHGEMPPPCPRSPTSMGTEHDGLVWVIMINPLELPSLKKLEMMHILQAQACSCISVYPGSPHQITKRETSDASKSQLNQASWNRTVLKFGSENQLNVRNYVSILFLWFSLDRTIWKKPRQSLLVWMGAGQQPGVIFGRMGKMM